MRATRVTCQTPPVPTPRVTNPAPAVLDLCVLDTRCLPALPVGGSVSCVVMPICSSAHLGLSTGPRCHTRTLRSSEWRCAGRWPGRYSAGEVQSTGAYGGRCTAAHAVTARPSVRCPLPVARCPMPDGWSQRTYDLPHCLPSPPPMRCKTPDGRGGAHSLVGVEVDWAGRTGATSPYFFALALLAGLCLAWNA